MLPKEHQCKTTYAILTHGAKDNFVDSIGGVCLIMAHIGKTASQYVIVCSGVGLPLLPGGGGCGKAFAFGLAFGALPFLATCERNCGWGQKLGNWVLVLGHFSLRSSWFYLVTVERQASG